MATKEGGMITGEERIRELLGQLYGTVNGYEGKPSDYQAARADSLAHELDDVVGEFQKLTQKSLPGVNAGLKKKKAEPITVLSEADWQKARESEGSSGAASGGLCLGISSGRWTRASLRSRSASTRGKIPRCARYARDSRRDGGLQHRLPL